MLESKMIIIKTIDKNYSKAFKDELDHIIFYAMVSRKRDYAIMINDIGWIYLGTYEFKNKKVHYATIWDDKENILYICKVLDGENKYEDIWKVIPVSTNLTIENCKA